MARRARSIPAADDQRKLDAIPGVGEWTLAHLNLFGRGRYDVPLAKDVGMRNAYARVAGVRTGSVERGRSSRPSWTATRRFRASPRCISWRRDGVLVGVGHNHRMTYVAAEDRYDSMPYRRCGRSGIKLPAISLGLWNRFGDDTPIQNQRAIIRRAFDLGITHIDLANNYGPPYGVRRDQLRPDLRARTSRPYRDELIISTKAGYDMWPGPYGEWGSRKYLLASLDQSLGRMGLDYVDIFYSHRFDPDTPLEETIGALDTAVRSGQGALRRHQLLLGRAHEGGGRRSPARSARRS